MQESQISFPFCDKKVCNCIIQENWGNGMRCVWAMGKYEVNMYTAL